MFSATFTLLLTITPAEKPSDPFWDALVAAVHHFAEAGEIDHLKAMVEKYPHLAGARQAFRQPRKPVRTDAYTPLHHAAERGRDDVVAFLIEKGADANADGGGGWTPLHVAARQGRLGAVKLLVKAGAKLDAKTEAVPESFGVPPSSPPGAQPQKWPAIPARTALQLAEEFKHADVAEFLKSAARGRGDRADRTDTAHSSYGPYSSYETCRLRRAAAWFGQCRPSRLARATTGHLVRPALHFPPAPPAGRRKW